VNALAVIAAASPSTGFFLAIQIAIDAATAAGIIWVLFNVMRLLLNWPSSAPAEKLPARVTSPSPDYPKIRAMEQDLYGEWFTVDGLTECERLRPHRMRRAFEVARESDKRLR
jgi:hypothetical protein